ncbi:acyl-ACP--UDP-N- acetylglucosamine O-acyltransferase [Cryobacterium ruanii]|uniref:Acyl-ACP--UDP-N-acetylglucosamine O-acyltransferase n=1 Tax=Cryobacterium ruanii TaxID=1259197 RepID=A0A4R9APE8_9MICO|nr:acyl-ACP--UDP-N- acetylglucosamine O-acyltransferase [Cryobacterium ruanii]TFD67296.1 acyl-ACP--UDP-N- acetylglucosamine O-acyltransferase [Cryobacterium ruanii]
MNSIHPTAIVGPYVTLGTGNTLGPFTVVGGVVDIGNNNWIASGVSIGCPPEVRSFPHMNWVESSDGPGVSIGSDNVFREGVQIHGGWRDRTRLGSRLFVMNQAYVAHDCVVEDDVTLASGVAIGGHVRIGRASNLGLGTTVHQRRVIGALAMVGMSSVVTRDIPPFMKAFGSPCRPKGVNTVGLARAGLSAQTVAQIEQLAGVPNYPENLADLNEVESELIWYREALTK